MDGFQGDYLGDYFLDIREKLAIQKNKGCLFQQNISRRVRQTLSILL